MLYLCRVKPLRHYLRGFLIAAWAGDKIAEFSFPEISFHFSLRPWFFFVSPAYAGKRRTIPRRRSAAPDHPRVCGEKGDGSSAAAAEPGSPPRMRGKVLLSPFFQPMPGITPAYAGKRVFASTRLCNSRDHPRMCGEKKNCLERGGEKAGSPPHVRGKANQRL